MPKVTNEELLILFQKAQTANGQALTLANLELEELPAEIGSVTSLGTLNLDGNALTDLPDEFANLQNLGHLSIAGIGAAALFVLTSMGQSITAIFSKINDRLSSANAAVS